MQHLFWRLNFLLLSGATNSSQMYYEAKALTKELDPNGQENSKELMTLYSKAKAYEAGEKVTLWRPRVRTALHAQERHPHQPVPDHR